MDAIIWAAKQENCSETYLQKLRDIAAEIGLHIDYSRYTAKRKNNWPVKSAKPWHLCYGDWTLLCAFATLEQLERNLRARAGC